MHNTFASTSMILINPIYYWSQSVTNLITVLFPWGLWIDKFIHKSDDLRKFMYKLPNILSNFSHLNSSELLILPFKYSLKMFNYNVILNFKCSFLLLCKDLSKSRRCYFVLLQTRQSNVYIQRATIPNLNKIKGQLPQNL